MKSPITGSRMAAVFLFLLFIDSLFYYQAIVLEKEHLYKEFHLIENLQALALILTFAIYATTLFIAKREQRIIVVAGALLWLTMFLREVDFEELHVTGVIAFLTVGKSKDAILAGVWLFLLGYLAKHFSRYKPLLRSLIFSKMGLVVFVGGLSLLAGDFFEKIRFPRHEFYEEILELDGYLLILFGSLFFPAVLRGIDTERNLQR
jgi:hypothetical protein